VTATAPQGGTAGGPGEPHPVLGRLAAELHRRRWPAELIRPADRSPHVLVHGGAPASVCERVFATSTGGLYIPGIRPHLAIRGNVRAAADRLIWILRARAKREYPTALQLAVDDLTALQRALAQLGHHGEVILPPPYLHLPSSRDGDRPQIRTEALSFCWDPGLVLGQRRHVRAVAETIGWALHAEATALQEPPAPPAQGTVS
jgi:hypothetical protein